MDIQDAFEFAKKLRGIHRRANTFGHDRERILEELIFAAENYEKVAEYNEIQMVKEYTA